MLCVYFEIPYERQLMRIAPQELETFLNHVVHTAEAHGAVSFQLSCATVYRFSGTAVAPVFSVYLFLRFLADFLKTQRKRILEYRVIIELCKETDSEDVITDCFFAYKNVLMPYRGFFASPEAVRSLKPYINFEYHPQCHLYSCNEFRTPPFRDIIREERFTSERSTLEATAAPIGCIGNADSETRTAAAVPKPAGTKTEQIPYRIYLYGNTSVFSALYHFMLLHPISDEIIAELLSSEEKAQYAETKNAVYYFRKHRFCSEYPDYFVDAFLLNTQFYFRAFVKRYATTELLIIYSEENMKAARQISHLLPFARMEVKRPAPLYIGSLPHDFIEIAYLIVHVPQFIFEDELPEFFLSLHKNKTFIASLYEWLYALGIIEMENDIYSANRPIKHTLESVIGNKKNTLLTLIAAFLWKKYRSGMLAPDVHLKNIFSMLQFEPDNHFMLHYFFYEYSDRDIRQMDLRPFQSARFFTVLANYQKTLEIGELKTDGEAVCAVKNVLNTIQKHGFFAGEYRALSYLAFLHLSQNKTEDAITYFHYALDSAETLYDAHFICEVLFNLSISYFLQNNLNASLHHLNRLQTAITGYFEMPQKIPCVFLRGRIALQLGEFEQAEALFMQAADAAATHFVEWEPLCKIWYARTLSQKGQTGKAQQILLSYIDASPDALPFLLESFVLTAALRTECANPAFAPLIDIQYEPYQSGFALAEELIWGKVYSKSSLQMFYTAFDSYYRFRITIDTDDTACRYLEILEETAREALRHRDMYTSLYLYLCYDAFLRFEGEASDTANGYLSRAFKALQNNIGSITENGIRDKFMFRNVWNAKLYAAAQKNKLI